MMDRLKCWPLYVANEWHHIFDTPHELSGLKTLQSASEVTTLWRYRNLFIIIIIKLPEMDFC